MTERITIVQAARNYGQRVHDAAGCTYGDEKESYIVHLDDVHNVLEEFQEVFMYENDRWNTRAAAYTHDTIEDAQQTFNNVKDATNVEVAKITLAVTDVPEENRLLRHLMTLPKTVKDYRALILKLCDLKANSGRGQQSKNSMYRKYQKEWTGYKRYILTTAISRYPNEINKKVFDELIYAVDLSHGYFRRPLK